MTRAIVDLAKKSLESIAAVCFVSNRSPATTINRLLIAHGLGRSLFLRLDDLLSLPKNLGAPRGLGSSTATLPAELLPLNFGRILRLALAAFSGFQFVKHL
jgi:hypothetical protein